MGNLIESATWSAGVPYFEADAILTGGPDCPDNIPIQALTNRTVFLKKQIDDAVSGALNLGTASKWKTARSVSINGDATWTVTLDGSANVTAALTLANSGIVAGTYPVATFDAKGRATGGRALQSSDLPANAALTGTPTAPTAAPGTNTNQLANTAFVQAAIAALVASSPAALDTLNELAVSLGNDPNFAATITNALAAKAPLASPTFTGTPSAPTPATGDSTTKLATTAFVQAAMAAYGLGGAAAAIPGGAAAAIPGGAAGSIDATTIPTGLYYITGANTGTMPPGDTYGHLLVSRDGAGVTVHQLYMDNVTARVWSRAYTASSWAAWREVAFTDSPALTGTPTAPTAAPGTNTTQLANTAFVNAAIAALVASSPAALDTLNELAAALGNDPNFATTITNALAAKAPLYSPVLTGTPAAPTAAAGTSTNQLATTAFVQQELAGDLATATPKIDGVGAVGVSSRIAREDHVHPTDTTRAPIASPVFTGDPKAPTPPAGDYDTSVATTQFVNVAIGIGQIALFASSAAPAGWLKANGAAISRTTYSALFTAIGTTFGAGDGATTFNIPDLRGEFLRGFDDGRGIDSGRVFGSWQNFSVESHTHGAGGASGTGANSHFALQDAVSATIYTSAYGGTETRPRNVALLPCIKY